MAVTPVTWIKAKALTAWVKSAIGQEPTIQQFGNEYLEIDFTPEQQQLLRDYFNRQVRGLFADKTAEAPDLQVRFGKVLIPWATQYLAPIFAGVFAMGWMGRTIIKGKR